MSTTATTNTNETGWTVEEVVQNSIQYQDRIATCYDTNQTINGDGIEKILLQDHPKQQQTHITRISGKVRDRYETTTSTPQNDDGTSSSSDNNLLLALVTTDRQSGFDRHLAMVPFKGAVLNGTSQFWFRQTQDIISNHYIAMPHPNVTIVKKCHPFPIEFVVRYVFLASSLIFLFFSLRPTRTLREEKNFPVNNV
jgi:phosphoribosylaminoimidazole-succinocarboxamide synthase